MLHIFIHGMEAEMEVTPLQRPRWHRERKGQATEAKKKKQREWGNWPKLIIKVPWFQDDMPQL